MPKKLLIGIDGGGTHSTAVAAYPDGRIAAVTEGGGLNFYNSGVETVRERLEAMINDLVRQTGCEVEEVCVGMSALDAPADDATTALFTGMMTADQLDLQSDAYIALMGFTQGKPGVIVICGTGSMLLMLDDQGRQTPAGGWGYLLGDAGLLAVIDASEDLAPATPLTEDALAFFGADTPRGLIDRIYAPETTTAGIAGFARHVLTRAQEGEPIALGILQRNMERLARSAAQLITAAPEAARVGLYGGIFQHSQLANELFTGALERFSPGCAVCKLAYPPELGALIHLYRKHGTLTDDVLTLLKSTYNK